MKFVFRSALALATLRLLVGLTFAGETPELVAGLPAPVMHADADLRNLLDGENPAFGTQDSPSVTENSAVGTENSLTGMPLLALTGLGPNGTGAQLRTWFEQRIAAQLAKDPRFLHKVARAKKKAHQFTIQANGPVRRGWCHNYWPNERTFVNQECGITWWLTPPQLTPQIIFD